MKDLYEALGHSSIRAGITRSWQNLYPQVEDNLARHPSLREYSKELRDARLRLLGEFDRSLDAARRALESRGATTYFAMDPEEARRIVAEIVGSRRIVVKSKSMVSEELHLREHLEALGNEAWETDLGEFIIHLAGQKPMHTIIPALHLSENEVARVLGRVGIQGRDAKELAEGARRFLRGKFLKADFGMTGCNAFSIETATTFLVDNEGNMRLTISLPKGLITLVSLDKLLPNDELCLKQVMLQAAFFGTYPPSYINTVKPTRDRSLYVVFIDNGRSKAREELAEQLICVKCGRCQLECPVFHPLGNLWGGDVYGGPMGMGWSAITDRIGDEVYLCVLCGKCKEVCPVEVDMPQIIWTVRRDYMRQKLKT